MNGVPEGTDVHRREVDLAGGSAPSGARLGEDAVDTDAGLRCEEGGPGGPAGPCAGPSAAFSSVDGRRLSTAVPVLSAPIRDSGLGKF